MFVTALVIATTLFPVTGQGIDVVRRNAEAFASRLVLPGEAPAPAPVFSTEARAVSNWRREAGQSLRPASLALVVRYAAAEPAFVARCVRLNNYWCIKSARWTGEIGADAEGHTGFAHASAGADAAAQLLRRYYRNLNRRSALAIVRRWAPSECRSPVTAPAPTAPVSKEVAPLGLRKTLRARYLARNTRGGIPKTVAARRGPASSAGPLRVQPWSARALMARGKPPGPQKRVREANARPEPPASPRNPTLLVKPSVLLVEPSVLLVRPSELLVKPRATASLPRPSRAPAEVPRRPATALADRLAAESAALPPIAAGQPAIPLLDLSVPPPLCASDETRIRNYATRIAGSVGLKIDDDLGLFTPDGRPSAKLAPVMLAMSAVELGTLRANPALVEAAIARLEAGTPAVGP